VGQVEVRTEMQGRLMEAAMEYVGANKMYQFKFKR